MQALARKRALLLERQQIRQLNKYKTSFDYDQTYVDDDDDPEKGS